MVRQGNRLVADLVWFNQARELRNLKISKTANNWRKDFKNDYVWANCPEWLLLWHWKEAKARAQRIPLGGSGRCTNTHIHARNVKARSSPERRLKRSQKAKLGKSQEELNTTTDSPSNPVGSQHPHDNWRLAGGVSGGGGGGWPGRECWGGCLAWVLIQKTGRGTWRWSGPVLFSWC